MSYLERGGGVGADVIVIRSLEDETGARCVDLLRNAGGFGWVECRRDPEDSHGWRRVGPVRGGFASEAAALQDAVAAIGWLERS